MKSGTLTCITTITLFAALAAPIRLAAANPVPLVYLPLVPDAITPGGSEFKLTVNGTGLVSGSVVEWNGIARATTFVSSSQLTADISASDIATAGTASVTVVNPSPGGGTSNTAFFEITPPSSAIALSGSSYGIQGSANSVAVADFNGDGKLDLAVAPLFGTGVSVLLGNGDGTFQTPVYYPTNGANLFSVAVADFNGDGKPDLVLANNYQYGAPGTVAILLGNGDGTFQAAVNYGTGSEPASVAVADFNGDGMLDLAVGNFGDSNISILLGNGDGTFQAAVNYGIGSQGQPWSVAVGDFNLDGKLDLAVANIDQGVSILLGNGDGTFQSAVNYSAGVEPVSVAVADFNGDGRLDLAVANQGAGVSILLGNGDGTFQSAVNYSAGVAPVSVAVGDLNGDGRLDLAVADQNGHSVSVLLGKGDGTFRSAVKYGVGSAAFSVALGDFNDAGRIDLAVGGTASVSILLQGPIVSLSPTSLQFANQPVGTSSTAQTVTLTNRGDGALNISGIIVTGTDATDFSQTHTCGSSLAVRASCTISVTFAPAQLGPLTAAVTITDNAPGSPQSIALTGTGLSPVSLSTTSLTFPAQVTGTSSAAMTVTLSNIGGQPLTNLSITVTGTDASDFRQTNTCGTSVPVGRSCTISVTFAPTQLGPLTAAVTIADNAPDSPQSVALSGTGLTPVSLSPRSLSFGIQVTGTTSAANPVTLTNIGGQPLKIGPIVFAGTNATDFNQTNNCGTSVPAGGNCTIGVTFTPAGVGPRSAAAKIRDSAPGPPQSVALTGTGVAAGSNVTLSPTSLTFATQLLGATSAAQTVTLTNYGEMALTIGSITPSGDFAETNTCGSSVASLASCAISVTFTPTQAGTRQGQLSIADNAGGSPQTVSLTGTGTVVTLNPSSLFFDGYSTHSTTLTNIGSTPLGITGITLTGSNAFSQTNDCGAGVGAGKSCTINVTFRPPALGYRAPAYAIYRGDISIADNGGGSPQTVPLEGYVF